MSVSANVDALCEALGYPPAVVAAVTLEPGTAHVWYAVHDLDGRFVTDENGQPLEFLDVIPWALADATSA